MGRGSGLRHRLWEEVLSTPQGWEHIHLTSEKSGLDPALPLTNKSLLSMPQSPHLKMGTWPQCPSCSIPSSSVVLGQLPGRLPLTHPCWGLLSPHGSPPTPMWIQKMKLLEDEDLLEDTVVGNLVLIPPLPLLHSSPPVLSARASVSLSAQ